MLSEDDLAGIDRAREAIVSSILTQDSEAYALSFTEDGVVMHPDSELVQGRQNIRSYVEEVFRAARVTEAAMFPVVVDGDGDLAYEVSRQRISVEPPSDQFKGDRQHLHVYRRGTDGVWRIAAAMSGNA